MHCQSKIFSLQFKPYHYFDRLLNDTLINNKGVSFNIIETVIEKFGIW